MFNESKSTQAAAHLLKLSSGSMNYMVLMKMLYLADRESLLTRGRPITWDRFVSMKYGPVLSRVHDLITEMPDPDEPLIWKKYISEHCDYKVNLLADPGEEELSEAEQKILDSIFDEYRRFVDDPFGFARHIHKALPEVIEVERGQQFPLPVVDILSKNQISEKERNAILEEIESLRADCQVLAS